MAQPYVTLPYDPTGKNPTNNVSGEKKLVLEYTGLPYGIITLDDGGFYLKGLKVYDKDYNKLTIDTDYIVTYQHKTLSDKLGLIVASAIVFINPAFLNQIAYVTAQMVGDNYAFSFTVIEDYIAFYNTRPAGYIPASLDYAGFEPRWAAGELEQRRWGLDTFQPYTLEIENIAKAITIGNPASEEDYHNKVEELYNQFAGSFNALLTNHIKDIANPHGDTKESVGLGQVQNYPVATGAIARQGVSNEHYMTPQLGFASLNTFAETPLAAHLNLKHDRAHGETPAQVGAWETAVVRGFVNGKYTTDEQVANSNNLMSDGTPYTFDQLLALARANLPTTAFTIGQMAPARLGFGTTNNMTVLLGDRSWGNWTDLYAEFNPIRPGVIINKDFGDIRNQAQLQTLVNNAYGDLNKYGPGTMVFTYRTQNLYWSGLLNAIRVCVVFRRSLTGWTNNVLGYL